MMADPRIKFTMVVSAIVSAVFATAVTVGAYYAGLNGTNQSIADAKSTMSEKVSQAESRIDARLSADESSSSDRMGKMEGRQLADETKQIATDAKVQEMGSTLNEIRNKLDTISTKVDRATTLLEDAQRPFRGR